MLLVSLKHELSSERDLNPLTLIDQDRITVLYFIFCTKGIEKKKPNKDKRIQTDSTLWILSRIRSHVQGWFLIV